MPATDLADQIRKMAEENYQKQPQPQLAPASNTAALIKRWAKKQQKQQATVTLPKTAPATDLAAQIRKSARRTKKS